MQARPGTIMCKFGDDPAICLREEAIFVKSLQNVHLGGHNPQTLRPCEIPLCGL